MGLGSLCQRGMSQAAAAQRGWKRGCDSPLESPCHFPWHPELPGLPLPIPTAQTLLRASAPCQPCLCLQPAEAGFACQKVQGRLCTLGNVVGAFRQAVLFPWRGG